MREPTGSSAVEGGSSLDQTHRSGSRSRLTPLQIAAWISKALIALWAILLCWEGVSWAFRSWPMLSQDELNNLGWTVRVPYGQILRLIPDALYNDRPTGFALERFLFDRFGFNYTPQLICFLVFHFANCAMAFVMFRRLGLRSPIAIAALGVFGALSTTAQTATYLGASFDVLCTFFLLGSTLTILCEHKWSWYLSALLYLFALRSKEFGIVIPVFLTALVAIRAANGSAPRRMAFEIGKRLWLHYAILLAFGARYFWLARDIRAKMPAGTPYYMDFSPAAPRQSLAYYAALVFGAEDHHLAFVAASMLVILAYAIVRRRFMILFGFGVFLVTMLPVSLLPNIRQPFYVYGPQVFLLLAVALCLQDILDLAFSGSRIRWWAGVCVALLVLAAASGFRASGYFKDRVHWSWMVRSVTGRSAASIQNELARIGPSAHIYVNNGQETPWLFGYGDCVYPRLLHHSELIHCETRKPEPELLALYERDSNEKYFVDYAPDGGLSVRFRALAPGVPERALKPCDAGMIDDQSSKLKYRGHWRALQQFGLACGGTLSYTSEPGAEASLVFNGTSVTYVYTRAYTRGRVEVLIDGGRREVVDQFSAGIEWRSEATYGGLAPGRHTITIRAVHSKAAASTDYDVDVDGFVVRDLQTVLR
jgi:hypothetical protein